MVVMAFVDLKQLCIHLISALRLVRGAATGGIEGEAGGERRLRRHNERHHGGDLRNLARSLHGDLVRHVRHLWTPQHKHQQ